MGVQFGHLLQGGLDELALHVTERDGELVDLDLVCKGKLGSLLMQLGELVIVLEDLLKGGLYELFLPFTDGDGEIVDLELELVLKANLTAFSCSLASLFS